LACKSYNIRNYKETLVLTYVKTSVSLYSETRLGFDLQTKTRIREQRYIDERNS